MGAFYGRSQIRARSRELVERARSGQGGVLLFSGEAGIGKSHAAEDVASQAQALGATVATGRCWEVGGAPAYWPWIQVFRELGMAEDPFSGIAADLTPGVPEARFAVFDRAVRALRARAAQRPLVIVLDDLHAADLPSLQLLLLLARQVARAPLLVVGAYRDAELELQPAVAPLLAAIAREAVVVPLARLERADVAAWLRDALPEASSAGSAQLYELTDGHPLFVVEALRLGGAVDLPRWTLGRAGVLDERLGRLSPVTHALLGAAAVLGRELSSDLLTALVREAIASGQIALEALAGGAFDLATPRPDLQAQSARASNALADLIHSALREALASSIVLRGTEPDSFRFSHVLLRDRLYAELLPSTREALHAHAARLLLGRGADAQAAVYHMFEAREAASPHQVAEVAERAAQSALARLAFEQAAAIARRALAMPRSGELSPVHVCSLELLLAEALLRMGEMAEACALCVAAAARAEQAGEITLLARAALVYGTELSSGQVDPQMVSLLRKAEAALPRADSTLRARVMTRLAASMTPVLRASDGAEVLALVRDSLAMARRLGDPHTLLYVLQFAATVGLLAREGERFAMLEETIGLARALQQRLVLAHALPSYITALLGQGELTRAEALHVEHRELVRELGHPLARVRFLLVSALLASFRADFAAADRLADEAAQQADELGTPAGKLLLLTHRLGQALLRGDPGMLLPHAAAMIAHLSNVPGSAPQLAWFLAGVGRVSEARERVQAEVADPEHFASLNLWELAGVGETCVLLGDVELAARVYPRVLQASDRIFWNMAPGMLVGPFARVLGDLAALLGRDADARRHYDAVIAFWERLGVPALAERSRSKRAQLAAAKEPALVSESAASGGGARSGGLPGDKAASGLELRREGELWTLTSAAGSCVRLKHSKGVSYLQCLLEQPGTEIHVLALAGIDQRTGDAGPVLDARAKAAYRQRLAALREELSEAESFSDRPRAERAQAELDALSEQLASAVGLGGRDRRAASDVERTRINVQRRLRDVIERISAADPELGRYLAAAVKTGTTCVYTPF